MKCVESRKAYDTEGVSGNFTVPIAEGKNGGES